MNTNTPRTNAQRSKIVWDIASIVKHPKGTWVPATLAAEMELELEQVKNLGWFGRYHRVALEAENLRAKAERLDAENKELQAHIKNLDSENIGIHGQATAAASREIELEAKIERLKRERLTQ